ncbi:MAG: hypothetical protein Q9190_001150 [Brigantiaea leucoxantha]
MSAVAIPLQVRPRYWNACSLLDFDCFLLADADLNSNTDPATDFQGQHVRPFSSDGSSDSTPDTDIPVAPSHPSQLRSYQNAARGTISGSTLPSSAGIPLITTINKWRSAYDLPHLNWSATLASHATQVAIDNGGRIGNEVHNLHDRNGHLVAAAQVIAPGQVSRSADYPDTPFELSFVGWLCEVPGGPLDEGDQCGQVSKYLHLIGPRPPHDPRGHFKILMSRNYARIGCGFARDPSKGEREMWQGQWVCDLI